MAQQQQQQQPGRKAPDSDVQAAQKVLEKQEAGKDQQSQGNAGKGVGNQEMQARTRDEAELMQRMARGKQALPRNVAVWMDRQPEWVRAWLTIEKQPPRTNWDKLMRDVEELVVENIQPEYHPNVRPDFLFLGQQGGLVLFYDDEPIKLRTGPGFDQSSAFDVPSGTPCRIVQWEGHWLEVEVEVNGQKKRAWVMSAMFTDEPAFINSPAEEQKKEEELAAQQADTQTDTGTAGAQA